MFRDSFLTGEMPTELGSLSNLQSLNLGSNQLSGEIPSELASLSNLQWPNLGSNQLSGEILSELGSLANLQELYLSGNQLTGCLPAGLQNVPNNDFDQLGLPFCGDTPGLTPTDPCGATVTADGEFNGEWAEGCDSELSDRGYARCYSFTLESESEVSITLESNDADTYLYLRAGEARSGEFLYENDDYPEAGDTE